MKLHCFVSVLPAFFFGNKTKWFSSFACCGLVPFLVVWCSILFCVFSPFNKKTPQNGHGQNQKKHKCRKMDKKSASAIVFTNSVPILGGGLKKAICWKHYKNSGFSIFWKKKRKMPKTVKKVESKINPFMVHNIIGLILDSKMVSVCHFPFLFEKSHSPGEKRNTGQISQKRETLDIFSLYSIYIYICIYARKCRYRSRSLQNLIKLEFLLLHSCLL